MLIKFICHYLGRTEIPTSNNLEYHLHIQFQNQFDTISQNATRKNSNHMQIVRYIWQSNPILNPLYWHHLYTLLLFHTSSPIYPIPYYINYNFLPYPIQFILMPILDTRSIFYLCNKAIMHKHHYLTPSLWLVLLNQTL